MEIPKVPIQEQVIYVQVVEIGDVIKSPQFRNLLYRDLIDQDPMIGFKVNPMKTSKFWDNSRMELIESPGFIQRKFLKRDSDMNKFDKQHIQLKIAIDPEREFVVVFIFRNTDNIKEYVDENDNAGHYPLTVIAKMLNPDGSWDDNGIEIWFNMQSFQAKNTVNEVISCGKMNFDKQRLI